MYQSRRNSTTNESSSFGTNRTNHTNEKVSLLINKSTSMVAPNNTVSLATVIIERDSAFPENEKFYNPANMTIQGNTTVRWSNNDTVLHTVTSGDSQRGPTGLFDSSLIQPSAQFNYTFTKVGNFEYYCTLHPFMKGMITVTKQIKPIVTIVSPEELPKEINISIVEGSSFPNNEKFFIPPEVTISSNGTVIWTNNDKIIHTVTSGKPREGPSGEFNSGIIKPGDKFNHTFIKTGTYDYYSNLHPYMIGKVIVGFNSFNLRVDDRIYPISFLLTGDGNQIQKISLQTTNPLLEIRMVSTSPGNLTLVIPRILLDKIDQNGKDDAFGVIGNRAVGFQETSTTPTSRTLVIQFEPGVNYIQIPGTKTIVSSVNQAVLPSAQTTKNNSKIPAN